MKRSNIYRKAAKILQLGAHGCNTPEYALLLLNRNGDDPRTHGEQLDDISRFIEDGFQWGLNRDCPVRADAVLGLLLLSAIAADEEQNGQA